MKLILPHIDILFASGEDFIFLKKDNNIELFINLINKYNIPHGVYSKNAKLNYIFFKKKKIFQKKQSYKKNC